ncbi:hypothetical protein Tsubulata_030096 [Turnera subulata]|uniref:Uncharacterized protein n=1 Tax=Turnera subulata TaxID=218843 RepID=A0A9Q0JID0_9ROSI|nr:hypothetical protein Tsubulata_030096 [Turnera subulata]
MSRKHTIATISFLFLYLVVLSSVSTGAIYRAHNLRVANKVGSNRAAVFPVLPQGISVPPSGPSKRHNEHTMEDNPVGAAKDGSEINP